MAWNIPEIQRRSRPRPRSFPPGRGIGIYCREGQHIYKGTKMAENPYAAPSAKVADVVPEGEINLATRVDRLLAAIVDGLTAIPVYVAAAFALLQKQEQGLGMGLALFIVVYAIVLLV